MRLSRRGLLGKLPLVGAVAAATCTPLGLMAETEAPTVEDAVGPIYTLAEGESWYFDTTIGRVVISTNDQMGRLLSTRYLSTIYRAIRYPWGIPGATETITRLEGR